MAKHEPLIDKDSMFQDHIAYMKGLSQYVEETLGKLREQLAGIGEAARRIGKMRTTGPNIGDLAWLALPFDVEPYIADEWVLCQIINTYEDEHGYIFYEIDMGDEQLTDIAAAWLKPYEEGASWATT